MAVFRDFSREAEVDRMKSTFVSIASHELRTPVSVIVGYIDMLLKGVRGKLTNEQQKTLERVAFNAEQMIGLVNNLLDKSMLEAGKLQLDLRPFSLQNLLDVVMDLMHTMMRSKKFELSYHIDDGIPDLILGDEQRLRQICINLVNNAIHDPYVSMYISLMLNIGRLRLRIPVVVFHWKDKSIFLIHFVRMTKVVVSMADLV